MTDSADELPRWNHDPRSRARTRGLLMALSRDRSWHFERSALSAALLAVPTFGLLPLLSLGRLVERWHRLEWTLLGEFARWMSEHQDNPAGRDLAADADACRTKKAFQVRPWLLAATAAPIVLGAVVALFLGQMVVGRLLLMVASLAVCQGFSFAEDGGRTELETLRQWVEKLNPHFVSVGMRAVTIPPRHRGMLGLAYYAVVVIVVVAQAISPWGVLMIPIVAALSFRAWNGRLAAVRMIHLQLIERLLEWMDDTGLPVEYDVVALSPDEIAAMIG